MTVSISSAVSSRCGKQADDDQSSAALLVDKYCHPEKTITFATPTANIIPGVMSDVAAISSLPPCVQSGLSAAVNAAVRKYMNKRESEACSQDVLTFSLGLRELPNGRQHVGALCLQQGERRRSNQF